MVSTIREAREQLHDGRLTPSTLLDATLLRIAETEPTLRAYAHVSTDQARQAAARADQELAGGRSRGPLHGIPIAVKDVFCTFDAPTEAGSRVLSGFRPDFDATAVQHLRTAGAVIIGKTVTHEFAYGQDQPPTRNARDPLREPGSSSAGSAVAVAAGSAFAALGTDTGGSVRAPAALNGVLGVKPTYGRISRHGVIPLSPSLDTVGIIATTSWDAAAVLTALAGRDELDASSLAEPTPDYTAGLDDLPTGLRIGVVRDLLANSSVSDEVRAAVHEALDALSGLGVVLVDVDVPEFEAAPPVGMTISLVDAAASHARLIETAADKYHPATRTMIEAGRFVSGVDYLRAMRARTQLTANVRQVFTTNRLDALAMPALPTVAAPVGELSADMIGGGESSLTAYLRHQFLANVTGLPALTVPCRQGVGLPVGLQLMAPPLHEHRLLQVASGYERVVAGEAIMEARS